MNYKKGQVLYRNNKKTHELEKITIVDVLYKLDRSVNSNYNHSAESLDSLIERGVISDDVNKTKLQAIRKVEEQFGIKLKEV